MARKNEAEQLLRQGLYPSLIARRMGISVTSVIQYLRTQVGEGSLRLSDVYFSWPAEKRKVLQQASRRKWPDVSLLTANALSREELQLFQLLRSSRVFAGDIYEYVSLTELAIHRLVRSMLECEYNSADDDWWRKGIPSTIRVRCVSRREEDEDPAQDPYAYTTILDLVTIIAKNWALFQNALPKEFGSNRKQFENDLARFNGIRNSVMHPVKERKWSEEDFVFVRRIWSSFGEQKIN